MFMFHAVCTEGTTNREHLIYWVFLAIPTRASVVVPALAWICCSESCECFKLSCYIFIWKLLVVFFFFPVFCLAGWSCHERVMSVTNNKTDMFTEDWRAGFILGINFDFCSIKKVWKYMTQGPDCFFRKVLTFPRMLLNKNKQTN